MKLVTVHFHNDGGPVREHLTLENVVFVTDHPERWIFSVRGGRDVGVIKRNVDYLNVVDVGS